MSRKTRADAAKAKAAKQKKIAIGGSVLLVAVIAYQGPKVLNMMNQKPKPVIGASATTPGSTAAAPTDPNTLAAPTLAGTSTASAPTTGADASSSALVSAVPLTPDPGQLEAFHQLATKDPFAAQASAAGAGASSGSSGKGSSTQTPPVTTPPSPVTPAPVAPVPSTATISLNGEQLSVSVGTDFPQSGATFNRVGAIFHLVSLTGKTAKISIVGGSYADGAPTITLTMGKPLTLQNTADGTRYVLILEPASVQPGTSGAPGGTSTTPTTTTPASNGAPMSAIVPTQTH